MSFLRGLARVGWSEAALARKCGLSQPHIHDVLLGKRALSIESADMVMLSFRLDAARLLQEVCEWVRPGEGVGGADVTGECFSLSVTGAAHDGGVGCAGQVGGRGAACAEGVSAELGGIEAD